MLRALSLEACSQLHRDEKSVDLLTNFYFNQGKSNELRTTLTTHVSSLPSVIRDYGQVFFQLPENESGTGEDQTQRLEP